MHRLAPAVLVAVVILAGCGGSNDDAPEAAAGGTAPDTVEVRVADAAVRAEVADDDAERALGLGDRARLGRDAGMYFVLTSESPRFWMKGMRFPLDMIWIKDARVVDVTARVPPPRDGVPDSRLPTYSPARPADRVLEVNAGWAARNGVRRGDRVRVTD
jgi:uncharacterized membrane protein (UPF0127 family)